MRRPLKMCSQKKMFSVYKCQNKKPCRIVAAKAKAADTWRDQK